MDLRFMLPITECYERTEGVFFPSYFPCLVCLGWLHPNEHPSGQNCFQIAFWTLIPSAYQLSKRGRRVDYYILLVFLDNPWYWTLLRPLEQSYHMRNSQLLCCFIKLYKLCCFKFAFGWSLCAWLSCCGSTSSYDFSMFPSDALCVHLFLSQLVSRAGWLW